MNATNKFDERPATSTFTRLAPIERMELEGLEAANRLLSLPFFIIIFSLTALISLSMLHFQLSTQQHNLVVSLTIFCTGAMLLGLVHFLKQSTRCLLMYSVFCAVILGLLAPLSW